MPKYNVHIYPVVHICVEDVEAKSMKEAIKLAEDSVDLQHILPEEEGNYAEDITGFFVDKQIDDEGNINYDKGRSFTRNGNPVQHRRKKEAEPCPK